MMQPLTRLNVHCGLRFVALVCVVGRWLGCLLPLRAVLIGSGLVGGYPVDGGLLAQDSTSGFSRISGKYVDIITDMPLSDDLRELPRVFDAAIPRWCEIFGVAEADVAQWRVQAHIMLERQRFQRAQLLPPDLPNFPYGFQQGDQIWVTEQPSAYYRRHLLLHEGTHWFMTRKYGRHGPPWLMEGIAEWLGTHRWNGTQLTMGIIPESKGDVPYWGRITLIQEQLSEGLAPSLETILRYGDTAHQQVEAYAWSWAAVIFLRSNPQSSTVFAELLEQPMHSDMRMTRWLFGRLAAQWPQLREQWKATLSELEYGYDPTRGILSLSADARPLSGPRVVSIDSQRSWQASGIAVAAGTRLKLQAAGEYAVAREPQPWICHPEGVTLEYYRGQPLGKLLLCVAAPEIDEPNFSQPLKTYPIGAGGEFQIDESGELQFRVNESSGGLADNSGTITITIAPLTVQQ